MPQAVAKGEAELALFVSNLLIGVPGLDYAGPVPAAIGPEPCVRGRGRRQGEGAGSGEGIHPASDHPAAGAVMKARDAGAIGRPRRCNSPLILRSRPAHQCRRASRRIRPRRERNR